MAMSPNDPTNHHDEWEERSARMRERWEARRARRMGRSSQGGIYTGHGPGGRLVIGSIVLVLGILFLLENLGIVYVERIWSFWPVILIGMGIGRVVEGGSWHSRFWGSTVAAVGLVLLANSLGYLPWFFWRSLWPILMICWGIVILLRGFGKQGSWTASSFVH